MRGTTRTVAVAALSAVALLAAGCGSGDDDTTSTSAATAKTGGEIVVHPFENLLIDCARDVGAGVIIRGLRAVADFEYEFQMVAMNQRMNDEIETVFLMADPHHQAVSSRLVKEIARLGGRDDLFVPEAVHEKLLGKYGPKKGR